MAVRDPDELIGYCGLYCGACDHFLRRDRLGGADDARSTGDGEESGFECSGCRSGNLYADPGCSECGIRACAREKGLEHCGECNEMPCERIVSFVQDGHEHHKGVVQSLRELGQQGPGQWRTTQAELWRCACGTSLCWKDRKCPSCGAAVT